jgi:hypothetical protein
MSPPIPDGFSSNEVSSIHPKCHLKDLLDFGVTTFKTWPLRFNIQGEPCLNYRRPLFRLILTRSQWALDPFGWNESWETRNRVSPNCTPNLGPIRPLQNTPRSNSVKTPQLPPADLIWRGITLIANSVLGRFWSKQRRTIHEGALLKDVSDSQGLKTTLARFRSTPSSQFRTWVQQRLTRQTAISPPRG